MENIDFFLWGRSCRTYNHLVLTEDVVFWSPYCYQCVFLLLLSALLIQTVEKGCSENGKPSCPHMIPRGSASAHAQIMLILFPPGNTQGLEVFIFCIAHWEMAVLAWHYYYSLSYEVKQNMLPRWRAGLVSRLRQWFCTLLWQNGIGHLLNPWGSSVQSSLEPAPSRLSSVCTWDAKRKYWDTLGTDPYSIHSIK